MASERAFSVTEVAVVAAIATLAAVTLRATGGRPAEPMTFATDLLLALVAAVFAVRLAASPPGRARAAWASAFAALAVAAALGGAAHALAPLRDTRLLWTATLWALGVASFGLLLGGCSLVLSAGAARWAAVALGIKLGFTLRRAASDGDFRWAVLDYGTALLLLLLLAALAWRRQRALWAPWAAGGIAVSLVAAALQQAGWDPHRHFNHNDLYHLVQMVGLWLLYRAGRASSLVD
jgi:hypothetical protein